LPAVISCHFRLLPPTLLAECAVAFLPVPALSVDRPVFGLLVPAPATDRVVFRVVVSAVAATVGVALTSRTDAAVGLALSS